MDPWTILGWILLFVVVVLIISFLLVAITQVILILAEICHFIFKEIRSKYQVRKG